MLTLSQLAAVAPLPGPGTATELVAQWGAVGLLIALLAWYGLSAIKRERDRADQAEAREQRLNEAMRTEVIPVLVSATKAIERVSETLPDLAAELKRRS